MTLGERIKGLLRDDPVEDRVLLCEAYPCLLNGDRPTAILDDEVSHNLLSGEIYHDECGSYMMKHDPLIPWPEAAKLVQAQSLKRENALRLVENGTMEQDEALTEIHAYANDKSLDAVRRILSQTRNIFTYYILPENEERFDERERQAFFTNKMMELSHLASLPSVIRESRFRGPDETLHAEMRSLYRKLKYCRGNLRKEDSSDRPRRARLPRNNPNLDHA